MDPMQDKLSDLLINYASTCGFKRYQSKCYDQRSSLEKFIRPRLENAEVQKYSVVPADEETTTFMYITGEHFLTHGVLGAIAENSTVYILDPFLPTDLLKAYPLEPYLRVACMDELDAYLVKDS